MNKEKVKSLIKDLIIEIGEDPNREGLRETPDRIANMYEEVFSGYNSDDRNILKFFHEKTNGFVSVKEISFYSFCEHHFMPFFGKVDILYIPNNGLVTGISKLARVIDMFAKRLQLQERLTNQIGNFLDEKLKPKGLIVLVEAEHLCMSMRGVKKVGAKTFTSFISGIFLTDNSLKMDAMNILRK